MAATPKAKFDAAVNVIRSLPKNGTFQPSHEMMLKFYGFYKQATEGPCVDPKPNFWEVVKKAKWDAWSKLKDMPRDVAMLQYVDELKTIIETMPQTENVAEFMGTLGNFYELVDDKSPIGEALSHSPLRGGSPKQAVKAYLSGANGDINAAAGDMNHSMVVEEILTAYESGDGGTEISIKTLDYNKNVNGEPEDEEGDPALTNGVDNEDRLTKRGSSETESDSEEFCDTSDEPVLVNEAASDVRLSASTPLNKSGNHVRFSDTNIIYTEVEVNHTGRVSPIEVDAHPVGLEVAGLPPTVYVGQNRQLSESMFVNAPSQESMDITSQTSMGRSQLEQDFSAESVISLDLNQSHSDTVTMRGGGETQQNKQGAHQSSGRGEGTSSGRGRGQSSGSGSGSRRGLFSGSGGGGRRGDLDSQNPTDVNEQIAIAMVRLQQDMNGVLSRLSSLETMSRNKAEEEARRRKAVSKPRWWPFGNLSCKTAAFIILWPFIAHFVINVLGRRKRPH